MCYFQYLSNSFSKLSISIKKDLNPFMFNSINITLHFFVVKAHIDLVEFLIKW